MSFKRTMKRKIMRDEAIMEPQDAITVPPSVTPQGLLASKRRQRRLQEDAVIYHMVQLEQLDLLRRFDHRYMREMAERMNISRGKLEKMVARVWDSAKKELRKEDAANEELANDKG
jgi:hypothetical protein